MWFGLFPSQLLIFLLHSVHLVCCLDVVGSFFYVLFRCSVFLSDLARHPFFRVGNSFHDFVKSSLYSFGLGSLPSSITFIHNLVFSCCPWFPVYLCLDLKRFNNWFDWGIPFSYCIFKIWNYFFRVFCSVCKAYLWGFVWHLEFFISSFISVWVFFSNSISWLNSFHVVNCFRYFSPLVVCVFTVFIKTFIRIFFNIFEHSHNCYAEVLILCFDCTVFLRA